MNIVLLVGSTGQLGNKIFAHLIKHQNYKTRVLVREDSNLSQIEGFKPEIVYGDLKDPDTLENAVKGVDIIISTANSAAPRKKEDRFGNVDIQGHKDLIDIAVKNKIRQFIYTSARPVPIKYENWIPISRSKIEVENYLKASGLNYTILQPDAFMDVYFTFMGTDIPTRGDEAHLVHRGFPFMQNFYRSIKDDISRGKIGMVGKGNVKHSFIAAENVAEFIVKSIDNSGMMNRIVKLGGPEALSALELKSVFENVLNKSLKIKKTPAFVMKMMGNIFSLFNPAASNIFKLNYVQAKVPSAIDTKDLADELGGLRLLSLGYLYP